MSSSVATVNTVKTPGSGGGYSSTPTTGYSESGSASSTAALDLGSIGHGYSVAATSAAGDIGSGSSVNRGASASSSSASKKSTDLVSQLQDKLSKAQRLVDNSPKWLQELAQPILDSMEALLKKLGAIGGDDSDEDEDDGLQPASATQPQAKTRSAAPPSYASQPPQSAPPQTSQSAPPPAQAPSSGGQSANNSQSAQSNGQSNPSDQSNSAQNTQANGQSNPKQAGMTDSQAAQVLRTSDYFKKNNTNPPRADEPNSKELYSKDYVSKMANDSKAPPEVQAACKHVMGNFEKMETSVNPGSKGDGILSLSDLHAVPPPAGISGGAGSTKSAGGAVTDGAVKNTGGAASVSASNTSGSSTSANSTPGSSTAANDAIMTAANKDLSTATLDSTKQTGNAQTPRFRIGSSTDPEQLLKLSSDTLSNENINVAISQIPLVQKLNDSQRAGIEEMMKTYGKNVGVERAAYPNYDEMGGLKDQIGVLRPNLGVQYLGTNPGDQAGISQAGSDSTMDTVMSDIATQKAVGNKTSVVVEPNGGPGDRTDASNGWNSPQFARMREAALSAKGLTLDMPPNIMQARPEYQAFYNQASEWCKKNGVELTWYCSGGAGGDSNFEANATAVYAQMKLNKTLPDEVLLNSYTANRPEATMAVQERLANALSAL